MSAPTEQSSMIVAIFDDEADPMDLVTGEKTTNKFVFERADQGAIFIPSIASLVYANSFVDEIEKQTIVIMIGNRIERIIVEKPENEHHAEVTHAFTVPWISGAISNEGKITVNQHHGLDMTIRHIERLINFIIYGEDEEDARN